MSSLREVAQRIQERNNALASEQATLELLQTQLALAKKRLAADEISTQTARKRLLTAVRSRHGIELDILTKKEEIAAITNETTKLQRTIDAIQHKTNELRSKFDKEHAPLYASHGVSTSLHVMQSEALLVNAEKKKNRREEKMHHLKSDAERQRLETERMREETERLRDDTEGFENREEEEDEEMVALTMQIRQVLSKVSCCVCDLYFIYIDVSMHFCCTENICSSGSQQCQGGTSDC